MLYHIISCHILAYPIIQSHDLTNTLIIVVRYFGGIKLGIPGLIRSYKTAAYNAISNSTIITKTIKETYEVLFNYSQMNNVMRFIKENNIVIIEGIQTIMRKHGYDNAYEKCKSLSRTS